MSRQEARILKPGGSFTLGFQSGLALRMEIAKNPGNEWVVVEMTVDDDGTVSAFRLVRTPNWEAAACEPSS